MDNINEILKTLPHQTDCGLGWLDNPNVERQYPWYARIFEALAPKSIFELGTYLGYSLATAAMVLPELKSIMFVDNNSYDNTDNNMAQENVEYARTLAGYGPLSITHANEFYPHDAEYDMAHIDGDHNYLPVLADLNRMFTFSVKPKVIIGHDYTLIKDVRRAVYRFCHLKKLYHMVLPEFNHGLYVISTGDFRDIEDKLLSAGVGEVETLEPK